MINQTAVAEVEGGKARTWLSPNDPSTVSGSREVGLGDA
jgi:hypothetical protein